MKKSKKVDKFLEEYIKRREKEEKIKKDMVSNDNYIEWLVSFLKTMERQRFCDDDWLYFPEKISKENKKNVDNLHLFVELCAVEARENLLPSYHSSDFSDGEVYVKYLDNYILVGSMSGQGTFFFAKLLTHLENNEEYIDWELVKSNELSNTAKKRREILKRLEESIKDAINNGIDAEYIHDTISTIERSCEEQDNN